MDGIGLLRTEATLCHKKWKKKIWKLLYETAAIIVGRLREGNVGQRRRKQMNIFFILMQNMFS